MDVPGHAQACAMVLDRDVSLRQRLMKMLRFVANVSGNMPNCLRHTHRIRPRQKSEHAEGTVVLEVVLENLGSRNDPLRRVSGQEGLKSCCWKFASEPLLGMAEPQAADHVHDWEDLCKVVNGDPDTHE